MSAPLKSNNKCNIHPIIGKDNNIILEFLFKFFFRDEPLNAAVNLMNEKNINDILKNHFIQLLNNGELNKNHS
jgi:hypothetical protein